MITSRISAPLSVLSVTATPWSRTVTRFEQILGTRHSTPAHGAGHVSGEGDEAGEVVRGEVGGGGRVHLQADQVSPARLHGEESGVRGVPSGRDPHQGL